MEYQSLLEEIESGRDATPFPQEAREQAFAQKLDAQDPLRHLRDNFVFPTKRSMKTAESGMFRP